MGAEGSTGTPKGQAGEGYHWLLQCVVGQPHSPQVAVGYSDSVSEQACITAIERTPTYCISTGELQRKKIQVAYCRSSPTLGFKQSTQNKVPLNGVPSCESLLSAGLAGLLGTEPTPLSPTAAFMCDP